MICYVVVKTMSSEHYTTTASLRDLKSVRPIVALTAYDWITGSLANASGADLILVGDSLGMTALGYGTTIPVTGEMMLSHTEAVARSKPRALLVTDVPFAEAHQGIPHLIRLCAQYLRAGAQAVKIEGGKEMQETIAALVRAGIPVLSHIGLLPQQIMNLGRYRKFGKTEEERASLLEDIQSVEKAGAFACIVEMVQPAVTAELTSKSNIPLIGIGSGPDCDGQILVITDVLGLSPNPAPSFAQVRINGYKLFQEALAGYVQDVSNRQFPSS